MTTSTINRPTAAITRAKLLWMMQRWQRDIAEAKHPIMEENMKRQTYRCPYIEADAHSLREVATTLENLANEIDDQNDVS